jgi:ribosomal protein L29
MKTKEKKQLFAKNLNELKKALVEAKEAVINLNLEKAQNKLKNTRLIYWKKKEIANILTAIREKELINENA